MENSKYMVYAVNAFTFTLMAIVAGGLHLYTSTHPAKMPAEPRAKVMQMGHGIEAKISTDGGGRRIVVTQDHPSKLIYGISAVDENKDGRFGRIYVGVDKGNMLEKYADLQTLENLYSQVKENGK